MRRTVLKLAFCAQKGGAGKTTAATNVAAELVRRGKKVLMVDADEQGSSTLFCSDAAAAGRPAPTVVAGDAEMHRKDRLPALIEREDYDAVIIDCPGEMGAIQRSALAIADIAVIPVGESKYDGSSLVATADDVRAAQKLRPDLLVYGLVSRVDKRRLTSVRARQYLKEANLPSLRSELQDRSEYVKSIEDNQGVTTFDPSSAAAHEVRALVDELLNLHRRHRA
jgi:chromosome partitioning protein